MNFDVRQLRAFIAVAEHGSFTRAAMVLNLSQPALTVQVRALEEALGLRLFDRNTRNVALTRLGRELLPELRRILRELEALLDQTRQLARMAGGMVRIAVLPSFASSLLPDVIAGFRTLHPEIGFTLRDVIASGVAELTLAEEVDLGITGGPIEDAALELLMSSVDRMHAVFPAGHALDDGTSPSLAAVLRHPLVLMSRTTSVRAVVDAAIAAEGLSAEVAAEATYMSTAVGMVRAGMGIAILPETAMEIGALPMLHSVLIDDPRLARSISVIKRRGRTLPPASSAFLDHLGVAFDALERGAS
ncbi:MAG TPA: LysR substrate-binding domain-containing protein [Bosea sp. (in: a-proteobacteria)]|jgi:DNA-binding transcriptional LysR family regulator|uniref:LysR family transcriptional regulator n=1 Tax=Bosea sp. (in: a-proteobacteria) TaxID=1871050 RepID=UPI002E0ED0FF|nr:LysR substrate-binding domain-containing protein [Bosea sp. (in: a-proteobacteria)]